MISHKYLTVGSQLRLLVTQIPDYSIIVFVFLFAPLFSLLPVDEMRDYRDARNLRAEKFSVDCDE